MDLVWADDKVNKGKPMMISYVVSRYLFAGVLIETRPDVARLNLADLAEGRQWEYTFGTANRFKIRDLVMEDMP